MFSPSFAAPNNGEFRGYTWSVENGTLYLTGSGNLDTEGPWNSYKKNIKTIDISGSNVNLDFRFQDYKNVSTIHIGKGVKHVNAFSGFSKKVKLIVDSNDFDWHCKSLKEVSIKTIELGEDVDNVIVDGDYVFNKQKDTVVMYFGSSKDVVTVPEGVRIINEMAFAGGEMKELRLPQSLEEIGNSAFIALGNATQITIPGNVTKTGMDLFDYSSKLKYINFISPSLTLTVENPQQTHFDFLDSVEELVIPNYVDISEVYVGNNKSLTHVIVGEGITKLDGYSGHLYEENCSNLIGVFLPKSLKSIGTKNLPYIPGIRLFVIEGSYAQKFAQKNGYSYKVVTPIEKVELSKESASLKVGKTLTLKATVFPKNATVKRVQWMSANENIATVYEGKIKATGLGECDILCQGLDSGLVTGTCHIIVE